MAEVIFEPKIPQHRGERRAGLGTLVQQVSDATPSLTLFSCRVALKQRPLFRHCSGSHQEISNWFLGPQSALEAEPVCDPGRQHPTFRAAGCLNVAARKQTLTLPRSQRGHKIIRQVMVTADHAPFPSL